MAKHNDSGHKDFKNILLTILEQFSSNSPINVGLIPQSYHQLIDDQQEIGWIHMLQGRFAIQWAYIKQQHMKTSDTDTHNKLEQNGLQT